MDIEDEWGPPPPAASPYPCYRCLSPAVGQPLDVTLLSDHWIARVIHWLAGGPGEKPRRAPCLGKGRCICHTEFIRGKWTAYIAAYDHSTNSKIAVILGPSCANKLQAIKDRNKGLRGLRCKFHRLNGSQFGPTEPRLESSPPCRPLPAEPDLRWTLRAMYGPAVWPLDNEIGTPAELEGGVQCAS